MESLLLIPDDNQLQFECIYIYQLISRIYYKYQVDLSLQLYMISQLQYSVKLLFYPYRDQNAYVHPLKTHSFKLL